MRYKTKTLIIKLLALAFFALVLIFPIEDAPSVEAKTAVTVAALDVKDGKRQILIQMNIPQQQAEGSSKLLIAAAEGKDIAEAFEKLSIKVGVEIELAHCGIILIGEKLAKEGFENDLDYLLSSGMVSPQITLFTCENSAEDFMEKLNQFSQTNGSGVFDVAEFSENSINIRIVSALTFLSENHLPSGASAIPVIGFEMQKQGASSGGGSDSGGGGSSGGGSSGGSGGGSSGGGSSGGSGGSETPMIKELTTCMLYKSGKAVATMDDLATKGLSMFDKKSSKGYFEADDVMIGDKLVSYVPMQVKKKDGNLKAEFKDGMPFITVQVDMKLETETRFNVSKEGIFASKEEVKKAISKRVEEIVRHEIEAAYSDCMDSDADALGIRTAFYKQCYDEYKIYADDEDFVKNVQVDYKIKVEVA